MAKGKDNFPFPNVDDCDRPACDDTVSLLRSAMERTMKNTPPRSDAQGGSEPHDRENATDYERTSLACPPGKGEIGTSSWTLLHTMASWYPDKPTKEDRKLMKNFVQALATFYPCSYCAADFQENIKEKPVRTESREKLCIWMCEQHNIVNAKLGKPTFPCTIEMLDLRWKKGDPSRCGQKHE